MLFTVLISLGIVYTLEQFYPQFINRTNRSPHSAKNIFLGLINAVVSGVIFAGISTAAAQAAQDGNLGVVRWMGLPEAVSGIIFFVLFDGWMYLWHRASHGVPFLWRFHRVHHSDLQMDSTTALRFHAGEIIFSHLARLIIIPLIGIGPFQLLLYELLLQPVIIFHHSNIALSGAWDSWLKKLIVSPNMHRVHHSQKIEETNSNYSSIFSFWDRVGKTFRTRENISEIQFGLPEFANPSFQSVRGMLQTPFHS